LPATLLDAAHGGVGVAHQFARARGLQARVLWIDATANLERVGSRERVDAVIARARQAGFNTIVYDVKPIVGFTTYPSALAPKIEEWRGQRLAKEFDPLAAMVEACRREGLDLLVALNAFSEGHRLTRTGIGYDRPELQTMQLNAEPALVAKDSSPLRLAPQLDTPIDRLAPDQAGLYTRRPSGAEVEAGLDSAGRVEWVGTGEVPRGGRIVAGNGKAAEWIRLHARIGRALRLVAEARIGPISQNQTQWPLMMNPHLEAVRERPLLFVDEILAKYPVQGLIFDDRLRFGGIDADFGPVAREQFERHVGRSLSWPDDVMRFTFTWDLKRGIRPGPWWDAWLSWRAATIRDWVREAGARVRRARPGSLFGVYQGSWYGEYAKFGSNWASPSFQGGFPFLTKSYAATGFAPEVDLVIAGAYYRVPTIVDALEQAVPTGRTVEAAGQLANRAVRDMAWTYAGVMLMDYREDLSGFQRALQAAAATTQGIMVFDLSHDIDRFWPIFDRAFRFPAKAPHAEPGALQSVRRLRAIKDRRGDREPPVPLHEGAPGAGF
jgi:hypothetical protein